MRSEYAEVSVGINGENMPYSHDMGTREVTLSPIMAMVEISPYAYGPYSPDSMSAALWHKAGLASLGRMGRYS